MKRLWAVLFLVGCGPAGKPFEYPLDKMLRLDDVQMKGTHNSYHIEKSDIPEWEYTMAPLDVQLDAQGVRQIELDVNYLQNDSGDGHHFEVFHVPGADDSSTCLLFVDCLRTVDNWSVRYPGHLPIYIQVEPKSGFTPEVADAFIADFEREILSVFSRDRILTPDELRGGAATLPAALAGGWPTLDKLRGRVYFAFDNRDVVRQAYTHGGQDLNGRLIFVDSDPSDPFGAISVQNDPVANAAAIAADALAHLLVRTRSDEDGVQFRANDMSEFQAALVSGAHFISTDFPAPVAAGPYFITIPDGTPARCNPLTAPPGCTPLALENPAFVGSGAH